MRRTVLFMKIMVDPADEKKGLIQARKEVVEYVDDADLLSKMELVVDRSTDIIGRILFPGKLREQKLSGKNKEGIREVVKTITSFYRGGSVTCYAWPPDRDIPDVVLRRAVELTSEGTQTPVVWVEKFT